MNEIFAIHCYDYLPEEELISFKGRAFEDIKIGDKLIYLEKNGIKHEYIVRKIIFYHIEMDVLDEGHSGELFVAGIFREFERGERLYIQS